MGNLEGSSAVEGAADVIVCDGFVGNIFLKTLEGTASFLLHELKGAFYTNALTKVSALLLKKHLSGMRRKLDPREVGGHRPAGYPETGHQGTRFLGRLRHPQCGGTGHPIRSILPGGGHHPEH